MTVGFEEGGSDSTQRLLPVLLTAPKPCPAIQACRKSQAGPSSLLKEGILIKSSSSPMMSMANLVRHFPTSWKISCQLPMPMTFR